MSLEAVVGDDFSNFMIQLESILAQQYHDILKYATIIRFLSRSYKDRSGGIDPTTARLYIRHIFEFCEFRQIDPDKVVAEARSSPAEYKLQLEEWFDHLVDEQDRDTSVGKITSVLAFLSKNGVEREDMRYKKPQRKGSREKGYRWAPTADHIRRAYSLEGWKSKEYGEEMLLYLLAGSQSALAASDLLSLDTRDETIARKMGLHPDEYESVEKQLRKGKDPVCIVTERKGGWLQITFFGSEVIAKIHELKKPSKDGRLFSFPEDGRVLRDYFVIVQEALNEPEFSSHKLRRYFETRLETELHATVLNRMMGHGSSGEINEVYSGLRPADLEPVYKRVYDRLRLFPTPPSS